MNERIKELAEQAREYARNYVADCKQYGYYMEHNELELRFEEKFAELIIRECLSFAQSHASQIEDYAAGIDSVHDRIKEHFGVEDE